MSSSAMVEYVRGRLTAKVSVQSVKGELSGIRKFGKLLRWKIPDTGETVKFMYEEANRIKNAS